MTDFAAHYKASNLLKNRDRRAEVVDKKRRLKRASTYDLGRQANTSEPKIEKPANTNAQKLLDRLERLNRWRKQKQQKIEEQKKNKTPLWVVTRCPSTFSDVNALPPIKKPTSKTKTPSIISNATLSTASATIKQSSDKSHAPESVTKKQSKSKTSENESTKQSVVKSKCKAPVQEKQTAKSCQKLLNIPPSETEKPEVVAPRLAAEGYVFKGPKIKGKQAKILAKVQMNQLTPTNVVTRHKSKVLKAMNGIDVFPQNEPVVRDSGMFNATYNTFFQKAPIHQTSTPFSKSESRRQTPKPVVEKVRRPSQGEFFELTLDMQVDCLTERYSTWEKILEETRNEIPPNFQDEILATVGQTKLLIAKKFEQFRSLTYGKNSGKQVENDDLQGFWDMISIQIQNLTNRYEDLEKLRSRMWVPEEKVVVKQKKKEVKPQKSVKAAGPSLGLREAIAARRKKFAETKQSPGVQIIVNEAVPVSVTPQSQESTQGLREVISARRKKSEENKPSSRIQVITNETVPVPTTPQQPRRRKRFTVIRDLLLKNKENYNNDEVSTDSPSKRTPRFRGRSKVLSVTEI